MPTQTELEQEILAHVADLYVRSPTFRIMLPTNKRIAFRRYRTMIGDERKGNPSYGCQNSEVADNPEI